MILGGRGTMDWYASLYYCEGTDLLPLSNPLNSRDHPVKPLVGGFAICIVTPNSSLLVTATGRVAVPNRKDLQELRRGYNACTTCQMLCKGEDIETKEEDREGSHVADGSLLEGSG